MGMKPPKNEAQSKLCEHLAIPGPQETGSHLPEANLVSSSKDVDESVKSLAPNLVAICPCGSNPG